MRLFIIGLAVLVAATGVASVATAQSPNTNVTASGVQVPPDHRYERYDPGQGKYGHVEAKDVPSLVEKKQWIYDRTDKVWVYRPQGGLNPRYAAGAQASGWQNIHGQVQTVSGSSLTLRADDGRTLTVDMAKVGREIQQAMKPGMPVTVTGHQWSGPNQFRAEYIQQDSSAGVQPSASAAQPVDEKNWQRIHGKVTSVNGPQLMLKADDGRTLTVDMANVGREIQQAMKPGMPVTVTGHQWSGPNQFRAEYIQQDSSAGVQPSASVAQPVDEKNWQRIHGKVTSVNGAQLTLKADDGRDLNVDMKDVNPEVQKALTPGEGVTVAGFYRGDDKNVSAKFIQQDSSAKK